MEYSRFLPIRKVLCVHVAVDCLRAPCDGCNRIILLVDGGGCSPTAQFVERGAGLLLGDFLTAGGAFGK